MRNYITMTIEDRIQEQKDRLKKIKSWEARIEKLAKRKKDPMSEAEFCRKYKFHPAGINRNKHSHITNKSFPTKKTVARVEAALKSEGV